MNRWKQSTSALRLSKKERQRYGDLLVYLKHAKGVLGEAAKYYDENCRPHVYSFWVALAECVAKRIEVLETDKALYDQTIGSR